MPKKRQLIIGYDLTHPSLSQKANECEGVGLRERGVRERCVLTRCVHCDCAARQRHEGGTVAIRCFSRVGCSCICVRVDRSAWFTIASRRQSVSHALSNTSHVCLDLALRLCFFRDIRTVYLPGKLTHSHYNNTSSIGQTRIKSIVTPPRVFASKTITRKVSCDH